LRATSRFSRTVRLPKMVGVWNLRPMPALAMTASLELVISCPRKITCPPLACVRPQMISRRVDLPAPFAPTSTRTSPARIERLTPSSALNPSKLTSTFLIASIGSPCDPLCTALLQVPYGPRRNGLMGSALLRPSRPLQDSLRKPVGVSGNARRQEQNDADEQ